MSERNQAKHLDENIKIVMEPENMVLGDISKATSRYFVRLPKDAAVSFPVEEELNLPEYPEYKAFLTGEMTGAEMAAVPGAAFIKLR